MRDWKEYQNNFPYPRKEEFRVRYWYRGGAAVAKQVNGGAIELVGPPVVYADNAAVLTALARCVKEDIDDEGSYKAALTAYGRETARLEALFRKDMFEELGITDNPRADKLYSMAWEHGHSSGYSEVYNYACDLAELIT
jgi:TPR repeat protein